ncbi:MAG: ABC transporter permease [Planctomycetes bacterium]|nr:ABC transporter permease [Planctomycetota bacterium]
MSDPLSAPFRSIWRHRALLLRTTLSDLRSRFAGSTLGVAWLVLYPLLVLSAYAAVQSRLASGSSGATLDYVLLVFAGLVPFLGFAEALATGTTAVSGNASLVKNTLFPIEMVPVKAVLSSQATQLVGTVILLVALGVTGRLGWYAACLPLVWLLQLVFTIGLIWVLSSLNVFVRDLQQMVGLMTLVLMLVSPIGYPIDSPTAESLRWLVLPNPIAHAIFCYQDCLIFGRPPGTRSLALLAVASAIAFWGGHWFFGRLKRVMTDNV